MSVAIGALTISRLQAQPYGYDETDVVNGLTARSWSVQGLLTPEEWLDLLGEYDGWQEARILDPDSVASGLVGSTVAFSGTANGVTWSNVPCWFTSAPNGEQAGKYISASFELVDAAAQLAVLLRQQEQEEETATTTGPNYGTFSLGGATLNLTSQPDGYAGGPQLERTVSGVIAISGPLGFVRTKQITGYTNAAGWVLVKNWYEQTVEVTPEPGSYYPSGELSMELESAIEAGVRVDRYVVSIDLWMII